MPTVSTVRTQKRKSHQEPVFPDRISFEALMDEIEQIAPGVEVKPKGIRRIREVMEKNFGRGLPKDQYATG